MAERQRLDLRGMRVDDVDLTGARLHSPNLEGLRITDGYLRNADISGDIDGLRVNGVEVAPLVEAELERRYPELVQLRACDPDGLAAAWRVTEDAWARTLERARALSEQTLHQRVDGEWSFVETMRHLIMATDSWVLRMVRGEPRPYHPWGLAGSWLEDPAALGLDYAATPSFAEVLAVRRERMDMAREAIAATTPEELNRVCTPPNEAGHPRQRHTVLQCLHVILDEEWLHNSYANRDLAELEHP